MSNDIRSFKKDEIVIVYDGQRNRNSLELAKVGRDCSYADHQIYINFGAFNVTFAKTSVHKLPTTLRKVLKEQS